MAKRKTKAMLAAEERVGAPLETVLPSLVESLGPSRAAEELGVAKASLGYWLLRFGLERRSVVVKAGERVIVRSPDGSEREAVYAD